MLADSRKATDVVGEGVDAGALGDAGVEDGADRALDVEVAPFTVLGRAEFDETVRAGALVAVVDHGDVDEESTTWVGVVVDVAAIGVAAIGRARITRAVLERTIAITEAPIDATSADRRERTWCAE